jgi:predicted AlkP superfamily phosphohydrolase/phosphomutase
MVKTILIGIDGASWNIIETLIKSEKLPFISKLVSNGTSGNLESSIPFLSSPAWKCLSTSKNPGKLGVYSFEQFTENGGIKIVNSKYFKAKEIWDFLSFNDYSNCIVNVPMTYPPPQNVKGIFISGIPALSHHNYSKPNHIKELLNKNMEYEINPKKQNDSLKQVNKQQDKLFSAIDTSIEYNGDFDFIQFVIFFIDNLSHENWNKGKWNSLLKESWTSIDTKIAEFISKYSDEKCNIFIVSDHGMTSLKGVFYVNEWLASIGLLSFNRKNKINII